ncbi:lysine-specific demethylase [Elysia marginata]|uniref:Lysine-specific demethylase n=1 Tax=Elysia marginata TaxID=1093978 RepID=A0AAV4ISE8_9GAST|nr:lysine-specific demethylase [Elysia marginata]
MREIDVIDVARQDDIKMIMREWTEYYNSPNREKILNVISLEFSNTKLSEFVNPPSVIRQISWARNVWPEQLPEDCTLARPEVQKYCLMGVKDSFTDFHIDFGGTSVWYHVLRGEKVFYLIEPTKKNLDLYEKWLASANQSEKFFGDQVNECYKLVVKQGHTLFIPTGWIHAVLTPLDSLVFGGNFLHNYNVPLQLRCHDIERNVSTPEKYMFPSYETMNWYAAKSILDIIKDFTEENKAPAQYLVDGAQALAVSLKSWTQRKDYPRVGKQDIAEYIQYGKLLKDLQKEVKKAEGLLKSATPSKQGHRRKKGEKPGKAAQAKALKRVKGLDVLEKLTKESLETADRERREKIYNFEDDPEEESKPLPFKSSERKTEQVVKPEDSPVSSPVKEVPQCLKFKLSNGKMVRCRDPLSISSTDRKKKGKRGKNRDSIKLEPEHKSDISGKEDGTKTDAEDVAVKSMKSYKSKGNKQEDEIVSKKSRKDKKMKKEPEAIPKLKLEKKYKSNTKENSKSKGDKSHKEITGKEKSKSKLEKSHKSSSSKEKSKNDSKKSLKKEKLQESSSRKDKSKSSGKKDKRKRDKKEEASDPKSATKDGKLASGRTGKEDVKDSDSDVDQLVVDENPKKPKVPKTTSTTKPASLKLKLPQGSLKMKLPVSGSEEDDGGHPGTVIRGGLNGSISDILTASGYNGDSNFKLDPDSKEAIAGMLTMSGLGDASLAQTQVFPRGGDSSSRRQASQSVQDEEEQLMEGCYRDTDFVYPSFELSDDEDESPKPKRKAEKDDSYNPRARLDPNAVKMEREHRPGAQREAIMSALASTAAKLAENPPGSKKHTKGSPIKPKIPDGMDFEVEPLPGPSSSLDRSEPVNAFRPGIKRPVDPCANLAALQASKSKKPKKGYATTKQRLGKLLKIKGMVF